MTTSSLAGITDADSATAALPKLGEAGDMLKGVSESLADAPAIPKAAISRVVGRDMGKLEDAAGKVMEMDGVGDILQPAVGPILETLKSMVN